MIVGSLLPWVKVTSALGTISFSGTSSLGRISLYCGICAVLNSFFFGNDMIGKRRSIFAAFCGIVSGASSLVSIINISNSISELDLGTQVQASVGFGIYMVFFGSIIVVVGGLKKN